MTSIEEIDMTFWEEYEDDEIGMWHNIIDYENGTDLHVLNETEAQRLFALTDRNRIYLRQWLPWVDATHTVEDSLAFIESALKQYREDVSMTCGIFHEGNLAGVISFHPIDWTNRKVAIGYWLGAEFQGKGLMTKACTAMINFVFDELKLNKVEIHCATGNMRSCAIPQRLGFTQEGVLRQAEWLYDHFVDLVYYGLLADEWKKDQ